MKDKNYVQLIGYVGADPHITNFQNGNKCARLRVATHAEVQPDGEEKRTTTDWHTIVAWSGRAVYAEHNFLKGSHILVDGYLLYRTYENKQGNKVNITEIIATSLINLDR